MRPQCPSGVPKRRRTPSSGTYRKAEVTFGRSPAAGTADCGAAELPSDATSEVELPRRPGLSGDTITSRGSRHAASAKVPAPPSITRAVQRERVLPPGSAPPLPEPPLSARVQGVLQRRH
ncbi:hypothetical protein NDU88_005927 [Pleurodeles waltl]|uniref:Uncharacterized protein n=1 Tax=Pleurodeles waltl TaxID=8319 RepID=A0AAV7SN57_PLEWA|nr:hypothetical protein NDU88_005927 [Pleurodeles waltl]